MQRIFLSIHVYQIGPKLSKSGFLDVYKTSCDSVCSLVFSFHLLPLPGLFATQKVVGRQSWNHTNDQQTQNVRPDGSGDRKGIQNVGRARKLGAVFAQSSQSTRSVTGDGRLKDDTQSRIGSVRKGTDVLDPAQPDGKILGKESTQEHEEQDDHCGDGLSDLDIIECRTDQLSHALSRNDTQ